MTLNNLQRLNKADENGRTPGQFLEQCYQSKSVPGGKGHLVGLFAEIAKEEFGMTTCLHCAASAMQMINHLGYAWEQDKHLLNEQYERDSANDNRTPATINTGATTIHPGLREPKEPIVPESPAKKRGRPFVKKG